MPSWNGMRRSRMGEESFSQDDEMRPKVKRSGVELDMSCPHCSAFVPVLIEWPEVVGLAQGQCPPGFTRTVTGHEFSVVCPRCEQHWKSSGKSYVERPGMSGEELAEVKMRQREISMTRPVGMETVARWLEAARRHGFLR